MNDITKIVNELHTARTTGKDTVLPALDSLLGVIVNMERFAEPAHTVIVAVWNDKHGPCSECGLSAAFYAINAWGSGKNQPLCAVCAANAAAEGQPIERIDKEE